MAEYEYLRKRARNIGLSSKDAKQLYQEFAKQLHHCGKHGAIQRFKAIGDLIVAYHAGDLRPHPGLWVKTFNRFPRCVRFLLRYDPKIQLSVAKLARSIRFDEVKPHQMEKLVRAVETPFTGNPDYYEYVCDILNAGIRITGLKPALTQPSKPDLVLRQFQKNGSDGTYKPRLKFAFDYIQSCPILQELPYVHEVFYPLDYRKIPVEELPMAPPTLGSINATQEGGGKLRMFAAPHKVVQCLLAPIHHWFDNHRSRLLSDCTYDQQAGALWAQSKLGDHIVHSVDLSTATCRFPLEPQLFISRQLGLDEIFVRTLEWACRGVWSVNKDLIEQGFPSTLKWVVGQPLGIKPSMSMFSLTHNLLLAGLCERLGMDPTDSFRILGDDVVLIGDQLHDAYRETIVDYMGIPISESKSHSSRTYAEFAGYSITKNLLVRGGKWPMAVMDNHISISEQWETPLHDEVSPDKLLVEKLWLFRQNKYDASSIEEYSRLLCANSLFSVQTTEVRDIVGRYPRFENGVIQLWREEYPQVSCPIMGTSPRMASFDAIFQSIPDPKWAEWARRTHEWWYDISDFSSILFYAYSYSLMAVYNCWSNGLLSFEDVLKTTKKIEARVFDFYWIPPVGDTLGGSYFHRKVMRVMLKSLRPSLDGEQDLRLSSETIESLCVT